MPKAIFYLLKGDYNHQSVECGDSTSQCPTLHHMSYSLNSLMGGYIGDYIGTTRGAIKGDTRRLDNGTYELRTKKSGWGDRIGLVSGG